VADNGRDRSAIATHVEAHPTKAAQVALGLVLGHLESNTSRETWRTPSASNAFYLETLRNWGYTTSAIEAVALGEADEVDTITDTAVADVEDIAATS